MVMFHIEVITHTSDCSNVIQWRDSDDTDSFSASFFFQYFGALYQTSCLIWYWTSDKVAYHLIRLLIFFDRKSEIIQRLLSSEFKSKCLNYYIFEKNVPLYI